MNTVWSEKLQSTDLLYSTRYERFNDYNKDEWFKVLGIKDGDKVLEVGCGSGHFCNMIKKNFPNCQVFGIDLDEGHINFAKQKAKELKLDVQYQTADIKNLPFDDNTFDVIYSYTVIEHLPFQDFISEQKRVLQQNGKLLIMKISDCINKYSQHKFDFLSKEIDDLLDTLQKKENIVVGQYGARLDEIVNNLSQFGLSPCEVVDKKIFYYFPDCTSSIEQAKQQLYNNYVGTTTNLMFALHISVDGEKYKQKLVDLLSKRYQKRLQLLEQGTKVFDFASTELLSICSKKL